MPRDDVVARWWQERVAIWKYASQKANLGGLLGPADFRSVRPGV